MQGLRELHLELCPGRVRLDEFDDEDKDVFFECVRGLVEKKPGVVNLRLPSRYAITMGGRWRQVFEVDRDAPWERLRCKAPDTER